MRHVLMALPFALVVGLAPSPAVAQDAEACTRAFVDAQALMTPRSARLLEARGKLELCSRPVCGKNVPRRCAELLEAVRSRIPSLVFAATDAGGRALTDVAVSVDGTPLLSRLDASEVELEPGEHAVTFATAGGARKEIKLTVADGEKARRVSVAFDAPPVAALVPPVATDLVAVAAVEPSPPGAFRDPDVESPARSRTRRYVGFGVAGAGAVGLGLAGWFGLKTRSQVDEALTYCNGTSNCQQKAADILDDARGTQKIAIVSLVAGAVATGAGVYLIVSSPSAKARTGPIGVGAGPSEVFVQGAW